MPTQSTTNTSQASAASATGARHVSIMQATKLVGVSRRTIYLWLKAGKLEYVRHAGGSIRILESSLWRGRKDVDG